MRGLLILAAIAGAAFLAAPAIVHNNVNPIIGGICSLATPDLWQRMKCELGAVMPQKTYTFGPGIQCSWQPPDKYYVIKPPLDTTPDGSYAIKFNDAFLNVPSEGNATLSDQTGKIVQATGQCHRVGGL